MTGISNMSSLLSANITMKQAEVQGNIRNQMKDSANVLNPILSLKLSLTEFLHQYRISQV